MANDLNNHRYFIRLSYDGTMFHGWQRQLNGITVQQTIEEAMTMMLRTPVSLTGAGRTDTGVHAADFYAHFDLNSELSTGFCEKLVFKLNSYLSGDIAIIRIFPVQPGSHARFSALSRTYRYCITSEKNPFRKDYTHFIYGELDKVMMNAGAALIIRYDDFTSFSKVDTDSKTNICRITHACWEEEGSELVFTITADRFLRNMVRAIVGTLLELGKGRITLNDLEQIIESKNRSNAGDSAPARGLVLYRIDYPAL
ncbi:MAG: tRNA pseudouridine(38-40) synthase TruA [Bacteroidetes bacterium]|nr:tRNA pseudouridine(38-40) synthase TruA [Bacteroidota bacterium]